MLFIRTSRYWKLCRCILWPYCGWRPECCRCEPYTYPELTSSIAAVAIHRMIQVSEEHLLSKPRLRSIREVEQSTKDVLCSSACLSLYEQVAQRWLSNWQVVCTSLHAAYVTLFDRKKVAVLHSRNVGLERGPVPKNARSFTIPSH